MPKGYTWAELINKANSSGVNLTAQALVIQNGPNTFEYYVYGAAVTEAIVDVLTGEFQLLRTDILYDCGKT